MGTERDDEAVIEKNNNEAIRKQDTISTRRLDNKRERVNRIKA